MFLQKTQGAFLDESSNVGPDFAQPKVGRGLAYGDFDNDGDLDLLMTTNNGPAYLYRNDHPAGNRSIRFHLVGTESNRDAIGATVRIYSNGGLQSAMVKSGSSYLSQSQLPVTFGVGKADVIERVVIHWPNGRTEEFKKLTTGRSYSCTEGKGIQNPVADLLPTITELLSSVRPSVRRTDNRMCANTEEIRRLQRLT